MAPRQSAGLAWARPWVPSPAAPATTTKVGEQEVAGAGEGVLRVLCRAQQERGPCLPPHGAPAVGGPGGLGGGATGKPLPQPQSVGKEGGRGPPGLHPAPSPSAHPGQQPGQWPAASSVAAPLGLRGVCGRVCGQVPARVPRWAQAPQRPPADRLLLPDLHRWQCPACAAHASPASHPAFSACHLWITF